MRNFLTKAIGIKNIKISNKVINISLLIASNVFLVSIVYLALMIEVPKNSENNLACWIGLIDGWIIAPISFIVLVYLWKYKEKENKIKSSANNKQIVEQSFVEIVFTGPWLRWAFTISAFWGLIRLNVGAVHWVVDGIFFILFVGTLIFSIPIYLFDCYLKQRK